MQRIYPFSFSTARGLFQLLWKTFEKNPLFVTCLPGGDTTCLYFLLLHLIECDVNDSFQREVLSTASPRDGSCVLYIASDREVERGNVGHFVHGIELPD